MINCKWLLLLEKESKCYIEHLKIFGVKYENQTSLIKERFFYFLH